MLPLHQSFGTCGVGGVGDGAVVGFFVVAVGGEGVGDAGVLGFEEVVAYGVVEALRGHTSTLAQQGGEQGGWEVFVFGRTGPVSVLLDFVDHVPTRSGGNVPGDVPAGAPDAAAGPAEADCADEEVRKGSAAARL